MKEEDPFRMPHEGPLALLFCAKEDKDTQFACHKLNYC